MDPEVAEVFSFVMNVLPWAALIIAVSIGGSIFSTWLKIRNGYPLQTSWGLPLHPKNDNEAAERIRLLTTENAKLRAEIGSVKDRLETLERIATDQPAKLAREIDSLTLGERGHA